MMYIKPNNASPYGFINRDQFGFENYSKPRFPRLRTSKKVIDWSSRVIGILLKLGSKFACLLISFLLEFYIMMGEVNDTSLTCQTPC